MFKVAKKSNIKGKNFTLLRKAREAVKELGSKYHIYESVTLPITDKYYKKIQ